MATRLLRSRLNERLARAATYPVTLLTAPAGFGKSVALRDYLETERVEAVRFDVRREQNTLLAFVRGLAEALEPLVPSALASFPSLEARTMAAADPAGECAEWFAEHVKRTVCTIVVDDLHHAAVDPRSLAFLADAIERTKGRLRWIVATRTDAGLPVATWIAYGALDVPVGEDELRFTADEALAAADRLGGASDAAEIDALRELTGGWAVALTIALRTRTQAADLRAAAAGTREMVYRYLAEQVFAELDPEVRRLLVDTCVFAAFDAAIAEALGASPEAFARLRAVPFVVSSESGYRYHDLFREFLESELRRSSERAWRAAAERAAAILQRRGDESQGLRLFAKIGDGEKVLEVLERAGLDLFERGEAETVENALAAIPIAARERSAIATGLQAMLAAARGHFEAADDLFRAAIAQAGDPPTFWTLTYRRAIELVRHGRDCAPVLAPLIDDPGMPGSLQAPILATLATGYAASGRHGEAAAAMNGALAVLEKVTSEDVRARVYQQAAFVYQFDARRGRAREYAEPAIALALRNNLFEVAARAYSVLYNVVYEETDDPIAALAMLDRLGECARKAASNQVRLFGAIGAYELEAERGDEARLDELDAELSRTAMTLPRARLEALLPAQALRLAWRGAFGEAFALLEGTASGIATPERRAVRAADTAVYALAAGFADRGDESLREARAALAETTGTSRRTVRARAMLALAETLRGRASAASRELAEAERGLEPHLRRLRALVHAARAFARIALGQAEAGALGAALERLRSEHAGGAARLISALPSAAPSSDAYALLTASERRVLDLLVDGASTKEIAARTGRSPQTVDTHVRAICRKLECRGRREAVALATAAGWSAPRSGI